MHSGRRICACCIPPDDCRRICSGEMASAARQHRMLLAAQGAFGPDGLALGLPPVFSAHDTRCFPTDRPMAAAQAWRLSRHHRQAEGCPTSPSLLDLQKTLSPPRTIPVIARPAQTASARGRRRPSRCSSCRKAADGIRSQTWLTSMSAERAATRPCVQRLLRAPELDSDTPARDLELKHKSRESATHTCNAWLPMAWRAHRHSGSRSDNAGCRRKQAEAAVEKRAASSAWAGTAAPSPMRPGTPPACGCAASRSGSRIRWRARLGPDTVQIEPCAAPRGDHAASSRVAPKSGGVRSGESLLVRH